MKDLAEACTSTFAYEFADGAVISQDLVARVKADIERWQQIEDEVRACKWVQAYVAQMIGLIAAHRMTFGEALMATACQMVIVGIEMERTELPLAAESVPGRRDTGYSGV